MDKNQINLIITKFLGLDQLRINDRTRVSPEQIEELNMFPEVARSDLLREYLLDADELRIPNVPPGVDLKSSEWGERWENYYAGGAWPFDRMPLIQT